MPDYLTKEEIRQWRSSLERITLEDYAKRLGKVIAEEKETNDMVDMVYKHSSEVRFVSDESEIAAKSSFKAERISSLAQQSFDREKEMSLEKAERDLRKTLNKPRELAKESAKEIAKPEIKAPVKKQAPKTTAAKNSIIKEVKAEVKPVAAKKPEAKAIREEVQITFKKNLTPREQAVFEHFINNKNQIVYAKELAQVLELPRDYVYKYIKNLRAKMNENAIQNADNGGFVLEMK